MREVKGFSEFPLYQVTKTQLGVARVRWLHERCLEIGVLEGSKFDTRFTTTLLDLDTGNMWSLGDQSSFCWRPGQVAYSPNRSQLAYATAEGLFVASLDGSDRRLLGRAGEERSWDDYQQLAFSPDGQRLAIHDCVGGEYEGCTALRVLDLEAGEYIYTYQGEGFMGRPTWSPDGHYLAFYTGFTEARWPDIPGWITTIVTEVETGQETWLPAIPSYVGEYGVCIAPQWLDGHGKVFLQTLYEGVWIGDPTAGQAVRLPGSTNSLYPTSVSPDKEWIAYDGERTSHLFNLSSGTMITLAASAGQVAWDPTGENVLIGGYNGEGPAHWIVHLPTGEQQPISLPDSWIHSAWSPDGRWLAYVAPAERTPPAGRGLWLIDSRTGDRMRIISSHRGICWEYDEMPQWSPDGRRVAFVWAFANDSKCELYLVDLSTLYP